MRPDLDLDQRRPLCADRRVGLAAARTPARLVRRVVFLDAFLEPGLRGAAVARGAVALAARASGARLVLPLAPAPVQRLRQHRPGRAQLRDLRLLRPGPAAQSPHGSPQPRVLVRQSPQRALPAPRPSQRPAQFGVRHRRRHRPRRVHRAKDTVLQLLLHRLGALQRMAQIPGLVGQRPDPLRLVPQAPRHVVVAHGVVEDPAQRRVVVPLLPQRLVQLADLAGLDFRARHLTAQPGDLPAQPHDDVPVRRHTRGREQVVQTAHPRPPGRTRSSPRGGPCSRPRRLQASRLRRAVSNCDFHAPASVRVATSAHFSSSARASATSAR